MNVIDDRAAALQQAGVPADAARRLADAARTEPSLEALQQLCRDARARLAGLPPRSRRTPAEKDAGEALVQTMADAARRFFRRHAVSLYRDLTDGGARPLRVDALCFEAARRWPGVLPSEGELADESTRMQADKDGLEIHQGLFVSMVLADAPAGHHLIRSMLRPRADSLERLDDFVRTGAADLGTVRVHVDGAAAHVTIHNERYLNSEDDTVVGPLEQAVDLALMHPGVKLGVLRGSVVDHPKHAGRRVFCSGINLTRIYQGKQSYLSFLMRNLALHSKIYRGVLLDDESDGLDAPLDEPERTHEKLWIAVVERFAIGGGCQLLLVVDHVIAERGSYFTLPARKEGFLPGTANMRLPRFVGERLAREAILFDRTFHADTPDGRLIANEVVDADAVDAALRGCIDRAVGSGIVSPGSNRKAMRQQTEPLEAFRRYLVTYTHEQAFCHLSEQLIDNLERHWNARQRRL